MLIFKGFELGTPELEFELGVRARFYPNFVAFPTRASTLTRAPMKKLVLSLVEFCLCSLCYLYCNGENIYFVTKQEPTDAGYGGFQYKLEERTEKLTENRPTANIHIRVCC